MKSLRAILVDPSDNVVTLVQPGRTGDWAVWDGGRVRLNEDIPTGHKVAIYDIPRESTVMKYGASIGKAADNIRQGEWVHVHNVQSERGKGYSDDKGISSA